MGFRMPASGDDRFPGCELRLRDEGELRCASPAFPGQDQKVRKGSHGFRGLEEGGGGGRREGEERQQASLLMLTCLLAWEPQVPEAGREGAVVPCQV